MAKKIRLDFSKVEERTGWNTKQMPEGLHRMKIAAVTEQEAPDGTAMLVYALVPTDGRFKARRFPFYCKLQQNQLWKLRDLLVAAGVSVPKKALNIDPDSPVGKEIAVELQDATGTYVGRSEVNATYDLSILDDEDGSGSSDDEDDESDEEEYEEEEAEDEDEADEDEDDEEEEDLNDLTLAELRKRAKGLGIDHTGVKKPELIELILEEEAADDEDEDEDELDEDDLDDEELEEEEFEDDEEEEEEEAPAPKRRAAPVKKAAPAAAKRVVKRR